jgi:hypothetical protein
VPDTVVPLAALAVNAAAGMPMEENNTHTAVMMPNNLFLPIIYTLRFEIIRIKCCTHYPDIDYNIIYYTSSCCCMPDDNG